MAVPSSPDATIAAFLEAVRANDVDAMARVWGSPSRGPSARYMAADERRQRLSVIRAFLVHERYQVMTSNVIEGQSTSHLVRVRLTRLGCSPVVPMTVVSWGGGWLISDIDLSQAGNPNERCPGNAPPPIR